MEIEFVALGDPVPQGSKSGFVRGGRVVIVEGKGKASARHKAWRALVAEQAEIAANRAGLLELLDSPVEVEIHFMIRRPKSKSKTKWWCDVTPDIDKLTRSVLDSLTHTILTNDSRVVALKVLKAYALDEPGIVVKIKELDNEACPIKPQLL